MEAPDRQALEPWFEKIMPCDYITPVIELKPDAGRSDRGERRKRCRARVCDDDARARWLQRQLRAAQCALRACATCLRACVNRCDNPRKVVFSALRRAFGVTLRWIAETLIARRLLIPNMLHASFPRASDDDDDDKQRPRTNTIRGAPCELSFGSVFATDR
jgi:hypothetical protein